MRTIACVMLSLAVAASAAAQSDPTAAENEPPVPFAFADFSWLTGSPRTTSTPLATKVFTGEFRADTNFTYSFNRPIDHTIGGSSEIFRSGEFQVTQLGVGGDVHVDRVHGRVMTQFGLYSQTTPRNDPSPARGQWRLDDGYRYVSEAYGGYRFNRLNGVNVQAGIFMSYIGLWSYYNFDNWTYQPSYVSSNTPWFFNGLRVQIFASDKLKIEPSLNNYWGADTAGRPDRRRIHTDDSVQVKYFDRPGARISKAAFSVTFDAGCEYGDGVSCGGGSTAAPSQTFIGVMAYHRAWLAGDRYAITVGGGAIDNPGRYLVLMPPINGATALSGSPYFSANPGDQFSAWDLQTTFDAMPSEFATFRFEYSYRSSSTPYFTGPGGVTPPAGNTGSPGSAVPGWTPDLRRSEGRVTVALLIKI